MEQRIVKIQIKNEYIIGSGVSVGAVGSHDDVLLEMDFRSSTMWDGTTRRAIFSNAIGENRTTIILTTNLLAEGHSEVYLVPVPAEAKDAAGECFLTVEGFVTDADGKEIIRCVTEEARFRVLPSKLYTNDSESITPSQAEQLQAEIDSIKTTITDVANAKEYSAEKAEIAGNYALTAESWAVGQKNGADVEESDQTYHNNAKWWSGISEEAKADALSAKDSAEERAVNARSWAVGGTGTRPGEDTNNAKYWSNMAEKAAGGGVISFNGRTGAVVPESGDYTADMVGTYSKEETDTLLNGKSDVSAVYTKTETDAILTSKADLDESGKVPTEQLPAFVNKTGDTMTGELKITKYSRYTGGSVTVGGGFAVLDAINDNNEYARIAAIKENSGNSNFIIQNFDSSGAYVYGQDLLHTGNKYLIFTYGTDDLTAGSSSLETGKLYFVYE